MCLLQKDKSSAADMRISNVNQHRSDGVQNQFGCCCLNPDWIAASCSCITCENLWRQNTVVCDAASACAHIRVCP